MDSTVNPATDPVAVVRAWIEGSQRARVSQDPADFERLVRPKVMRFAVNA